MRPSTPRIQANSQEFSESKKKFLTPSTRKTNKHSFSTRSPVLTSTAPNFYSKSPKKTPKVDLKHVFQKNPTLYLKEDLGKNIDDILGKVYDTVVFKKNQKEDVEIKQEILLKEIKTVEKEILPLVFKKKAIIQEIEHEKQLFLQYQSSLRSLQEKTFKKKDEIQEKKEKMEEKIAFLTSRAKDITQENANLSNEILLKRSHHKTKIEELRKDFEQCKRLVKEMEFLEEQMKKKHDVMKIGHNERISKLKNKEKAFLGIIKH